MHFIQQSEATKKDVYISLFWLEQNILYIYICFLHDAFGIETKSFLTIENTAFIYNSSWEYKLQ